MMRHISVLIGQSWRVFSRVIAHAAGYIETWRVPLKNVDMRKSVASKTYTRGEERQGGGWLVGGRSSSAGGLGRLGWRVQNTLLRGLFISMSLRSFGYR